MAKSQIIQTVEREGRTVHIYDNGMERDAASGRMLRPPTAALITCETANAYQRKRQEKAAAELRRRIAEAARQGMPPGTLIRHSADAFAAAGVQLFEEVVMNSDAYPRDRMEAFEKLGKYAGVLPADMKHAVAADGTNAAAALQAAAAGMNAEAARILARVWADVARIQAERLAPLERQADAAPVIDAAASDP